MKKVISRIFVRVIAVSLIFLNFKKDVFAQSSEYPGMLMQGGVPQDPSQADILSWINSMVVVILAPLSLLLAIIFYARYFFMKKKTDELSKIKTRKTLKKAKIFLIISILLVALYAILRQVIV